MGRERDGVRAEKRERARERQTERKRERERAFIVKYSDKSSGIRTPLFCFAVEERRGRIPPIYSSTLCIFSGRLPLF